MHVWRWLLSAGVVFVLAAGIPAAVSAQELATRLTPSEAERLANITERAEVPFSGLIVTPKELRTVSDDKYHLLYRALCAVYIEEKANGQTTGWHRRFAVHAPDAQALPIARRVAKTLLALHGMTRECLKTDHARNLPTVHVWLTRAPGAGLSADVGGEQFQNQIYLYDLYAERKPIEWLREVAHEYGHYALPQVAGFSAPEEWSNGILGERLYLLWLAEEEKEKRRKGEEERRKQGTGNREQDNTQTKDSPQTWGVGGALGVKTEELETFLSRQVTPLIARWASETPDMKRLTRTDASGMDDYTGFVLYWYATYGSAGIRDVFASSSASQNGILSAADIGVGALASLRDAPQSVIMSPLKDKSAPFWIYLPNGAFSIETKNAKSWQILPEGKPPVTRGKLRPNDIFIKERGWYKLKLTPENADTIPRLVLKRIYTN